MLISQITETTVYMMFHSSWYKSSHQFYVALVTGVDKESIKSTSIYLGLVKHLARFQGTICKRSRRMWKKNKTHSFIMWTSEEVDVNCFLKAHLPWSWALNSCMISGYEVENIITALYFQCELSGEEKAHKLSILVCFFLFTIAADLGSVERTLHPVCCKAPQYRKGFKGILSSLASSLLREWAWDQQGPAYPLVLRCLKGPQTAGRKTLIFCPYSLKRGNWPGYIIVWL